MVAHLSVLRQRVAATSDDFLVAGFEPPGSLGL